MNGITNENQQSLIIGALQHSFLTSH